MKSIRVGIVFNIIPEIPAKTLGIAPSPMGGWLMSMVEGLLNIGHEVKIDIISPYNLKELKIIETSNINYILIPKQQNSEHWKEYIRKYQPNIIHVNGTEFNHTEGIYEAQFKGKVIVSLQGIVSEITQHVYGGITQLEILKNVTLKDIIRKSTLFQVKKSFQKQGQNEINILYKADGIIGRTDWDESFIKRLNLKDNYYKCNENLRDSFYESRKWSYNQCTKHTIFCSQATLPYKGFHILLEALPFVKMYYPDVKVRIAGYNPTGDGSFKQTLLRSTYGSFLKKQINKRNLENNIEFIGVVSEESMVSEYLNANVFVQSSFIENSPNSLGEALLLGVPSIASNVGGTSNFLSHEKNGLMYDSNDSLILGRYIINLFNDSEYAVKLGENGSKMAEHVFNRQKNATDLYNIYSQIIEK